MQSQVPISVIHVAEEFRRIVKDVERKKNILQRRCGNESIDVETFVMDSFYLVNGQRFVQYEGDIDLSSLRGKLLSGYPKLQEFVITASEEVEKEEEDSLFETPVFTMPFLGPSEIALQSISVAPQGGEFDFAVAVTPPRKLIRHQLGSCSYMLEEWNGKILDVIKGPDREERKPYTHRRAVIQKLGLPIISLEKEKKDKLLYIRDGDPYVSGGRGGYAFFNKDRELAVERVVTEGRCDMYVTGSLASGCERTMVATHFSDEPPGISLVIVNLHSLSVISTSQYVHDIIDFYNVENCLPRSLDDIHLKLEKREGSLNVSSFLLRVVGDVTGVGFRRRIYDLFFGSRVRMKIKNVGKEVQIQGYVPLSDFFSFRFKLDSAVLSFRARVIWVQTDDLLQNDVDWSIEVDV